MKKYIFGLLGICLLIGIPFIIMDRIAANKGKFNIPNSYEKIKINLNDKNRDGETILTRNLKEAAEVSFMIQSDSDQLCTVTISSDKKLIGSDKKEEICEITKMIGYCSISPKLLLQPGNYKITLTNKKTNGKIMIGYKEKKMKASEYERLMKVDQGDLDNPPDGYEKVYSVDLSGLNCKEDIVYTLKLDRTQKVGFSLYTNSTKGNVSVDFAGGNSDFYGLINSFYKIRDRMQNTYSKGTYEFKLTSNNADGQVYIYIKK